MRLLLSHSTTVLHMCHGLFCLPCIRSSLSDYFPTQLYHSVASQIPIHFSCWLPWFLKANRSLGFHSTGIYNYQAYLPEFQSPVYLSISAISLETSFCKYGLPFFFFFFELCAQYLAQCLPRNKFSINIWWENKWINFEKHSYFYF